LGNTRGQESRPLNPSAISISKTEIYPQLYEESYTLQVTYRAGAMFIWITRQEKPTVF
jgi:hypothetical protein